MEKKDFIKQRIIENKKILTEKEREMCIQNLETIRKIYNLGRLDVAFSLENN